MALRLPRSPVVVPIDPTTPSFSTLGRLRRFYAVRPSLAFAHVEQWLSRRLAHNSLVVTRVALGIIFLWFGALKFMPTVTAVDALAERTLVLITFHLFQPAACLHVLAFFECLIGLGFLTGRFLHVTILLLFLQMPGTFLPMVLLPQETWLHFPWFPSFEGQYIIKNFVLISAGLIVASTIRGGRIIANPEIAARAEHAEQAFEDRAYREREKLSHHDL